MMRISFFKRWLSACAVLILSWAVSAPVGAATRGAFAAFCIKEFAEQGVCPENVCWLQVSTDDNNVESRLCLPRQCPDIAATDCPEDYCTVMTSCANEEICFYRMEGEPAKCGDLAYAGQDVDCCKGFVRRCGIEFIDGTCDMEGRNSVYNLPICIPCGDGFCTNFENRCNCPEDCGNPLG